MRTISNLMKWLFLCGLFSGSPGMAQDEPADGFIRLVHAVTHGSGPMRVEVDSVGLHPKGYSLGAVTGAVCVAPGVRVVKFSRDGVSSGTTRVQILPNQTTSLIAFSEKTEATLTTPEVWSIKVLHLKIPAPSTAREMTWVSVSARPEVCAETQAADGSWRSAVVKRLGIVQVPVSQARGYAPMKVGIEKMPSIPVASHGRCVVVFYDDEMAGLKSVSFYQAQNLRVE
jgi:hypothetical protein